MSDKHTPGPWTFVPIKVDRSMGRGISTRTGPFVLDRDSKRHVASVNTPPGPHPSDSEHEANARLIAAAPDLLAACEAALEVMNTAEEFHDGAEGTDARLAMESAVARVRGGK